MRIQLSDHFTFRTLLRFTFPSMITMVFISLYGIVDGLFVTNFSGKSALAAINFVYPILSILSFFGYMVGVGGSALVARHLGARKMERANELFSMFVCLCTVISIILTIVGLIILRPVLIMLGAEGQMLSQSIEYGRILLFSLTFWNLQYLFQIFFVTAEKPALGLCVTVLAGVTNMVLDALFIAVFQWGLVGAALASATGQIVGGAVPLVYFCRKNNSLLRLGKVRFDGKATLKGISNGVGEFISGLSNSLVGILYNAQLLRYAGEDGVAAFSIMLYVSMIFNGIFAGYVSGSAPIVGYHYGSYNFKELKNLLKKGITLLLSGSGLLYGLAVILAVPLCRLFAGYDPALYEMTLHGFRFFSMAFLFMGLAVFGPSFFTSLNNGLIAAILSFLRTFVFQVAGVLLIPLFLGIDGIWLSYAVAQELAAVCTVAFLIAMRKKSIAMYNRQRSWHPGSFMRKTIAGISGTGQKKYIGSLRQGVHNYE